LKHSLVNICCIYIIIGVFEFGEYTEGNQTFKYAKILFLDLSRNKTMLFYRMNINIYFSVPWRPTKYIFTILKPHSSSIHALNLNSLIFIQIRQVLSELQLFLLTATISFTTYAIHKLGNVNHPAPCSVNRCNRCGNMGLVLWNDTNTSVSRV